MAGFPNQAPPSWSRKTRWPCRSPTVSGVFSPTTGFRRCSPGSHVARLQRDISEFRTPNFSQRHLAPSCPPTMPNPAARAIVCTWTRPRPVRRPLRKPKCRSQRIGYDVMNLISLFFHYSHYLILIYGFYICVRAYSESKRKAWLLIGVYCISFLFIFGINILSRAIHRKELAHHRSMDSMIHSTSTVQDAKDITNKEYPIRIPFFDLALVAGLRRLARDTSAERKS